MLQVPVVQWGGMQPVMQPVALAVAPQAFTLVTPVVVGGMQQGATLIPQVPQATATPTPAPVIFQPVVQQPSPLPPPQHSQYSQRSSSRHVPILPTPAPPDGQQQQSELPAKKNTKRNLQRQGGEGERTPRAPPPPPRCEECGKEFGARHALKLHVEEIHRGRRGSFACGECGQVFSRVSSVERHHVMAHGGEGRLPGCEVCGKRVVNVALHFRKFHCRSVAVEAREGGRRRRKKRSRGEARTLKGCDGR